MNNSIGKRLAHIRSESGLSQEKFAERTGISRAMLAQLETDRAQPSFEFLTAVVREFNKSYDYIIEGREPEKSGTEGNRGKLATKVTTKVTTNYPPLNETAHFLLEPTGEYNNADLITRIKYLELKVIRLEAENEAYLKAFKALGEGKDDQETRTA